MLYLFETESQISVFIRSLMIASVAAISQNPGQSLSPTPMMCCSFLLNVCAKHFKDVHTEVKNEGCHAEWRTIKWRLMFILFPKWQMILMSTRNLLNKKRWAEICLCSESKLAPYFYFFLLFDFFTICVFIITHYVCVCVCVYTRKIEYTTYTI